MSRFFVRAAAALVFFVCAEVARSQVRWVQYLPSTSPSPRGDHAMAYDSARGVTVLFGGSTDGNNVIGDTWEWNGTSWTQRSPATSPLARRMHAMVYDSNNGRTILFGGIDAGTTQFADTWEWNGANWVQRTSATSPPDRYRHAMVYDSIRRKTVLFGGLGGSGFLADTWEWNGTNWTQRIPVTSPPARFNHAMAYDFIREKTILFGGLTVQGIAADTWEWDGTDWVRRTPAASPSGRYNHAMAYNSRTVLFGGYDGTTQVADTWEWDGLFWTQMSPQPPCAGCPAARTSHALAYHAARQQTFLFGGNAGSNIFNDTWGYIGGFPLPSIPCSFIGPGHFPVYCATRPTIGTIFILTFNNPGNAAGFNLVCLGARLDPPLRFGPPALCEEGWVYPVPSFFLQSIGNPTALLIQIPNEPMLVGQSVAVQGASLEVTGCFRLTDGLQVTVQAP